MLRYKTFPILSLIGISGLNPGADAFTFQARGTNLERTTCLSSATSSDNPQPLAEEDASTETSGLYRPFAEHAWSKLLQDTDWFVEDSSVPEELRLNEAPAKGMPDGTVVRMEVKALQPKSPLVRYARYALLETLVPDTVNSTVGIQVLNLVVFPAANTNLPVFGADMVSLPGDRHLLLLDAQPMDLEADYPEHWNDWHRRHVVGSNSDDQSFPWGGDIPGEVAKYVSKYALWSRLIGSEVLNPATKIQTDMWDAYQEHLELYLQLLEGYDESANSDRNEQGPYIQYRLQNDPARPMLKSLYGEEWTERVLEEVLFPNANDEA